MDRDEARERSALFGWPTVFDAGVGVLYFFTSHMVIRALYYVGLDRTAAELGLFFLVVVAAVILAHGCAGPLLRSRLIVEARFGVPAVSVVAAVGAVVALVSTLPVVPIALFFVSGALLGLACGWIVVIWSSTLHVSRPDAASFYIDPALMVAVAAYFLFRCVSSLSEAVAQGFLLALPLVALACIVRSDKRSTALDSVVGARAQSLEVLVVVAATFAVGCSLVVYFSGRESEMLPSGLNYMVLFEVLAVVLLVFCCGLLRAFAERCGGLRPRIVAMVTVLLCLIPPFAAGLLMGGAGIPAHSPDALWESNMWVLVIAIFAYDIRDSPFAVRGLAIGLMFEAMCVAQLIARLATLPLAGGGAALAAAAALAVLYLGCVVRQLLSDGLPRENRGGQQALGRAIAPPTPMKRAGGAAESESAIAVASGSAIAKEEAASTCSGEDGRASAGTGFPVAADAALSDADEGVPAEIAQYCRELAADYGLTPREAEILALMALGRSAKYISEELLVSYNTTRTHVRHIYEKLNIHSKQELIDLVLFGSGVM